MQSVLLYVARRASFSINVARQRRELNAWGAWRVSGQRRGEGRKGERERGIDRNDCCVGI